jgi:hypothetical protein
MSDPSLELQIAIVTALKGETGLSGLVDDRIFDRVPPDAEVPYISFGPDQVLSDDAECLDAFEMFPQIDIWSRAVGRAEAKAIAGVVRAALHDAELTLSVDFRLVEIRHQSTRYLTDPDGVTSHAAMTFRALVDSV